MFYREERTMSILKLAGELEEEKNKIPHGRIKKICVTNKLSRNSCSVFEEISSSSLECNQNKADKLVAFSRGLLCKH